jgi:hypothetical protein
VKYIESPLIRVVVNKPTVDWIDIHSKPNWGWTVQGWKGKELAAPDQVQDYFHAVLMDLADYVDDSSVWLNADTGDEITVWKAMKLLTVGEGQA